MKPLKVFISAERIAERVRELAEGLDDFVGDDEAVFIANLKGSVIFFSDLIRCMKSCKIIADFIATESYVGRENSGELRITHDVSVDIQGKKVVLVEDIVDTGLTLRRVIRYIKEIHKPSELRVCVLLDKPSHRESEIQVDDLGFEIADEFVVGYGLDYNQKYRNIPYIAVLES